MSESDDAALAKAIKEGAPAPGYVFGWVERLLMRLLPSRVIPDSCGRPYLARYFLWPFWKTCEEASKHPRAIMLHHILKSDEDRDLHCHPWNFVSLLLWGGYVEVLPCQPGDTGWDSGNGFEKERRWGWLSVVRHQAEDRHRLILEKPAWSLVFRGEKRRPWGFWTKSGWVHWTEYVGAKKPC